MGERHSGVAEARHDPLLAGESYGAAGASFPSHLPGRHGHSTKWKVRRVLLVAWDAVGWAAALVLAAALRDEFDLSRVDTGSLQAVVLIAVVAQILIGLALQTYRGRHPVGTVDDAVNVTATTALVGVVVFLVDFFVRPKLVPLSVPLLAVSAAVLFAVGSRLAFRLYRERRYRPDYSHARRTIIYGAGLEGQQMLRLMLSDPAGGYLPVALLDDDLIFRRRRISGVAVHGTGADVAAAAAQSQADLLVIADRTLPPDGIREIASAAAEAGLGVAMVPALSDLLRPLPAELLIPSQRSAGDGAHAGAVPRAERRPALPVESRAKRALDVALCMVSLLILLPLLLVIAAVLKATSGEVIYRAPRIGRDGRPFTMFKFVTMIRDDSGPRVTRDGDPRITRVGHWLRATKLNELPQIVNVIKGDMSLVGPRPEDPRYAAHYSPHQQRVLAVRPGLTSRAFLQFGDEQAFIERARPSDVEQFYLQELLPEKLDIELGYVDNWSLREDLRILAGTVRGLLR